MSASLVLSATRTARSHGIVSRSSRPIAPQALCRQLRCLSVRRSKCSLALERSSIVSRPRVHGASVNHDGVLACQRATFSVSTKRKQIVGTRAEGREKSSSVELSQGKLQAKLKATPAIEKAIKLEMEWIHDRLALSNRVSQILEKDDLPKAYNLVIAAQRKKMDTIVSWNMIMDYMMKKGSAGEALKIYNNMKKRGCKPNPQTYTILLKGLQQSANPRAVDWALEIYESLWSLNPGKAPSTTHSNAVLGVCSQKKNMKALWEVAGRLPEDGYGSPDGRTFTIILNAIRYTTESELKYLDEHKKSQGAELKKKAAAVREGKRIWAEVLYNWRRGRFDIDQPLVSAMAHLLLAGGREQEIYLRDIFLLLNQTMGIPLLDKRLRRPSESHTQDDEATDIQQGHNEFDDLRDFVKVSVTKYEGQGAEERQAAKTAKTAVQDEEAEFNDLFNSIERSKDIGDPDVDPQPTNDNKPIVEATNNEFSLILEACLKMSQAIRLGRQYWHVLRSPPFNIKPDRESLRRYLDLLCFSRASADVLRILQDEMENGIVTKLSFNLAMLTCQRDIKNPNIFSIATELLDLMRDKFTISSRRTVDLYLEIVNYAYRKDPASAAAAIKGDSARKGTDIPVEHLQKDVLATAVAHVQPHIKRLIDAMSTPQAKWRNTDESFKPTVATLSNIKALYDRLLAPEYRSLVSAEEIAAYKEEVKTLGLYCKHLGGMLLEESEE